MSTCSTILLHSFSLISKYKVDHVGRKQFQRRHGNGNGHKPDVNQDSSLSLEEFEAVIPAKTNCSAACSTYLSRGE
jgi:hypothetical protein